MIIKIILCIVVFALLSVPLFSDNIPPVTITPYASNPVLSPDGSGQDAVMVNNPELVYAGGTWTIAYAAFNDYQAQWNYDGWLRGIGKIQFATGTTMPGAMTKTGITLPDPSSDYLPVEFGPSVLWDGSIWHMWVDLVPKAGNQYPAVGTSGYSIWHMGHLTNSTGSVDSFPTTGWVYESYNDFSLRDVVSGWNVQATYEVVPKDGGGWICYMTTFGDVPSVRYATASSLYGPWTYGGILASGTYFEFATYFTYNGKYYLIVNHVYDGTDILESTSQTGPFTISYNQIFSSNFYVTSLWGTDMNGGTLYGCHEPGAVQDVYIGLFTMTAPVISGRTLTNISTHGGIGFR